MSEMPDGKQDRAGRDQVRHMFNSIALRYDCVNRLLSLRRDVVWRGKLAASLSRRAHPRVLDIATGTGDVLLTLLNRRPELQSIVGADVSEAMLGVARQKIRRAGVESKCGLAAADAAALCFPDATFDVATVAFGVRNFSALETGLKEIRRVLRDDGQLLILEFSLPENRVIRAVYLAYFRHLLPRIGGWISRRPHAYRYLNATVEAFPYGVAFMDILSAVGFHRVERHPLSFGIASLYIAYKDRTPS